VYAGERLRGAAFARLSLRVGCVGLPRPAAITASVGDPLATVIASITTANNHCAATVLSQY